MEAMDISEECITVVGEVVAIISPYWKSLGRLVVSPSTSALQHFPGEFTTSVAGIVSTIVAANTQGIFCDVFYFRYDENISHTLIGVLVQHDSTPLCHTRWQQCGRYSFKVTWMLIF